VFVRLLLRSEKHDALFAQIRGNGVSGTAWEALGFANRQSDEERFRADWHQDYPHSFAASTESSSGVHCLRYRGPRPRQVLPRSHKGGLVSGAIKGPRPSRQDGAYALVLRTETA